MNNSILILGDSGTGKSSAIRTLPPAETFIINIVGKALPFRGSAKNYTRLSTDGLTGNFYCSDNADTIKRVINMVNVKRPEIKYLVIDDAGYICMNAFMKRALQKGYDRFSEIASEFNTAIELTNQLRDDLFCFVTMHIETDKQGKTKPKTIGNMIDQYICIEGKFSYILHTMVIENSYKFLTGNDGTHMAKSSMDCLPKFIDNDLMLVVNKINEYNNEDVSQ
jgi:hypothetical protein